MILLYLRHANTKTNDKQRAHSYLDCYIFSSKSKFTARFYNLRMDLTILQIRAECSARAVLVKS